MAMRGPPRERGDNPFAPSAYDIWDQSDMDDWTDGIVNKVQRILKGDNPWAPVPSPLTTSKRAVTDETPYLSSPSPSQLQREDVFGPFSDGVIESHDDDGRSVDASTDRSSRHSPERLESEYSQSERSVNGSGDDSSLSPQPEEVIDLVEDSGSEEEDRDTSGEDEESRSASASDEEMSYRTGVYAEGEYEDGFYESDEEPDGRDEEFSADGKGDAYHEGETDIGSPHKPIEVSSDDDNQSGDGSTASDVSEEESDGASYSNTGSDEDLESASDNEYDMVVEEDNGREFVHVIEDDHEDLVETGSLGAAEDDENGATSPRKSHDVEDHAGSSTEPLWRDAAANVPGLPPGASPFTVGQLPNVQPPALDSGVIESMLGQLPMGDFLPHMQSEPHVNLGAALSDSTAPYSIDPDLAETLPSHGTVNSAATFVAPEFGAAYFAHYGVVYESATNSAGFGVGVQQHWEAQEVSDVPPNASVQGPDDVETPQVRNANLRRHDSTASTIPGHDEALGIPWSETEYTEFDITVDLVNDPSTSSPLLDRAMPIANPPAPSMDPAHDYDEDEIAASSRRNSGERRSCDEERGAQEEWVPREVAQDSVELEGAEAPRQEPQDEEVAQLDEQPHKLGALDEGEEQEEVQDEQEEDEVIELEDSEEEEPVELVTGLEDDDEVTSLGDRSSHALDGTANGTMQPRQTSVPSPSLADHKLADHSELAPSDPALDEVMATKEKSEDVVEESPRTPKLDHTVDSGVANAVPTHDTAVNEDNGDDVEMFDDCTTHSVPPNISDHPLPVSPANEQSTAIAAKGTQAVEAEDENHVEPSNAVHDLPDDEERLPAPMVPRLKHSHGRALDRDVSRSPQDSPPPEDQTPSQIKSPTPPSVSQPTQVTSPRRRARTSVTRWSPPTTRSRCTYQKLHIQSGDLSVTLLVPGCAINHAKLKEEEARHLGVATDADQHNANVLAVAKLHPEISTKLSRIVGLDIVEDEGQCGVLDASEGAIELDRNTRRHSTRLSVFKTPDPGSAGAPSMNLSPSSVGLRRKRLSPAESSSPRDGSSTSPAKRVRSLQVSPQPSLSSTHNNERNLAPVDHMSTPGPTSPDRRITRSMRGNDDTAQSPGNGAFGRPATVSVADDVDPEEVPRAVGTRQRKRKLEDRHDADSSSNNGSSAVDHDPPPPNKRRAKASSSEDEPEDNAGGRGFWKTLSSLLPLRRHRSDRS